MDTCTSLVAQTVKRLSTMQETRVRALGWEDALEKEMAIHSSILAWRIPWTENLAGCGLWGHKEWDTTEQAALPTDKGSVPPQMPKA